MAITVVLGENTAGQIYSFDLYEDATSALIKDGHLEVGRWDGGDWEPLAQYAPEKWVSWSLDEHRKRNPSQR